MINLTSKQESYFWAKVDKNGPNGCWVWTACINENGYGHFNAGARRYKAHRVAYVLINGQIPDGLCIDHTCKNRACVNPQHLEAVTNLENTRRGSSSEQKTTCARGHVFTEQNTRIKANGDRICRECRRIWDRAQRINKKRPGSDPEAFTTTL